MAELRCDLLLAASWFNVNPTKLDFVVCITCGRTRHLKYVTSMLIIRRLQGSDCRELAAGRVMERKAFCVTDAGTQVRARCPEPPANESRKLFALLGNGVIRRSEDYAAVQLCHPSMSCAGRKPLFYLE